MERTPLQTSSLARDVYALTDIDTLEEAYRILNTNYKGAFEFSSNDLVKGRTGGPGLIKCRTAFGFTLIGKGKYEGEYFIIFRGTQYLADWLTNLNVLVSRSACGEPVHDGFNQAFMSMKPQITNFMNALPKGKIKAIHCIGHSLGGAIATICAEWITKTYGYKPYLYTFGSPRVGLIGFADMCTKRVGVNKIFRVYHKTDIVPFIPTWPFYHTPSFGLDYYLYSPGNIPWATYHNMGKYVESISKIGDSWKLLAAHRHEKHSEASIINWLKHNTVTGLSITALELLNEAVLFVLKKCMKGAGWILSDGFSTTFTLLDKIAYILHSSIDISKKISEWVVHLIRRMLQILGYGHIVEAGDLSREYIRDVFIKIQHKVNAYAKDALSQTLVKGRAI